MRTHITKKFQIPVPQIFIWAANSSLIPREILGVYDIHSNEECPKKLWRITVPDSSLLLTWKHIRKGEWLVTYA